MKKLRENLHEFVASERDFYPFCWTLATVNYILLNSKKKKTMSECQYSPSTLFVVIMPQFLWYNIIISNLGKVPVFNLSNASFLPSKKWCSPIQDKVTILYLVHSQPSHFERRQLYNIVVGPLWHIGRLRKISSCPTFLLYLKSPCRNSAHK